MTEKSATQDEFGDTPTATSGTSEADADHSGDTASPDTETIGGIGDDQLPEDLQPTDDNPLAKPLDPDAEDTKSRAELEMDAAQEDDAEIAGEGATGEGAQGDGISQG
ncbi:hypothetical protein EUA93_19600 [Nocardioides oleivorans]|uniref:Uncharacterized protein n=1 Tax=Nocardioides oleivorans TaxID=273676 RepID=A0A4Q2RTJ7_9ACTN|nr:hypothetical protein [Nocardioides oleivorans]RYB91129.1 hypothetical protein EUA93_19600 [Nocardioides oleivorans]